MIFYSIEIKIACFHKHVIQSHKLMVIRIIFQNININIKHWNIESYRKLYSKRISSSCITPSTVRKMLELWIFHVWTCWIAFFCLKCTNNYVSTKRSKNLERHSKSKCTLRLSLYNRITLAAIFYLIIEFLGIIKIKLYLKTNCYADKTVRKSFENATYKNISSV